MKRVISAGIALLVLLAAAVSVVVISSDGAVLPSVEAQPLPPSTVFLPMVRGAAQGSVDPPDPPDDEDPWLWELPIGKIKTFSFAQDGSIYGIIPRYGAAPEVEAKFVEISPDGQITRVRQLPPGDHLNWDGARYSLPDGTFIDLVRLDSKAQGLTMLTPDNEVKTVTVAEIRSSRNTPCNDPNFYFAGVVQEGEELWFWLFCSADDRFLFEQYSFDGTLPAKLHRWLEFSPPPTDFAIGPLWRWGFHLVEGIGRGQPTFTRWNRSGQLVFRGPMADDAVTSFEVLQMDMFGTWRMLVTTEDANGVKKELDLAQTHDGELLPWEGYAAEAKTRVPDICVDSDYLDGKLRYYPDPYRTFGVEHIEDNPVTLTLYVCNARGPGEETSFALPDQLPGATAIGHDRHLYYYDEWSPDAGPRVLRKLPYTFPP